MRADALRRNLLFCSSRQIPRQWERTNDTSHQQIRYFNQWADGQIYWLFEHVFQLL